MRRPTGCYCTMRGTNLGERVTTDRLSIVMRDDAWSEGFSARTVVAYRSEMRAGGLLRSRCEPRGAPETHDDCDGAEGDDAQAAPPQSQLPGGVSPRPEATASSSGFSAAEPSEDIPVLPPEIKSERWSLPFRHDLSGQRDE